jgi:hypothetical protein
MIILHAGRHILPGIMPGCRIGAASRDERARLRKHSRFKLR